MVRITCMRGFSGSGKSTIAAEIAKTTGAVIVCRDNLRQMLLGSYWTGKTEDEDNVTVAEEAMVDAYLRAGTPVVVDATHLYPPFLRKWARLATRLGVDFEVVDVKTDNWECMVRDAHRDRSVGKDVILKQAKRWPMEKWPTVTATPFTVEPVEWIDGLPEAIICDLDGTLAHIPEGGRSPYDYTRVLEDEIDYAILGILADYKVNTYGNGQVLIVSGRDHTCHDDTVRWLNVAPHDKIWMRDANDVDERGNKRPDYMVKYDIFNNHIRGVYNVRFVLDDRDQVVEMWRKLGLKCLQVQGGNF